MNFMVKSLKEKTPARAGKSMIGKVKSDFPKHSLEDAMRVPQALFDANGGKPLPPLDLSDALNPKMSPGSSEFRTILSSSIKYGLTSGSFNSERVSLEPLGRDIMEPTSDASKQKALVTAALTPQTFKSIYEYFRGKKLPDLTFFQNTVVREFQVPREHAVKCVEIFLKNAEFAKLIRNLTSGKWLSTEQSPEPTARQENDDPEEVETETEGNTPETNAGVKLIQQQIISNKVFIAHGSNLEIVKQLKDLLTFGKFEPFVSIEKESTAQPLPDKVIGEMRQCSAAVINVASEETLLDSKGVSHHRLNENVLIEIGAAMALYGKNFILLVQKGIHLPSDLQGLYRCDYEGEKLDYDATMKLLKTINLFRNA
jgi:predicted nucleotide-binding protein